MEESVSIKPSSIKFGLILGGVSIVYSLILQLTGLIGNQALSYVSFIFVLGAVIMAHKEFKESNNGFMAYGQGVKISLLLSLISSVISGAFTYIYIAFVDDSMIQMIMDKTREELEANPQMTEEAIEMAINMQKSFMTPTSMLIFAIIGGMIGGLIIGLIVSAITKKTDASNEI